MKRILSIIGLVIIALFVIAMPIMAITYSATISVWNGSVTDYTNLPIIVPANNTGLVSSGLLASNGLNANVITSGTTVASMLTETNILYCQSALAHGGSLNSYYNLGVTPAASMPIITGYGGYFSTSDYAALEPSSSFKAELNGYINFTYGGLPLYNCLFYKPNALELYVSAANTITARIIGVSTINQQQTSISGVEYSGVNWFAQTFTPSVTAALTSVSVSLFKSNFPSSTITLGIYATTGGNPTGVSLASATMNASAVVGGFNSFVFGAPPTLTSGTLYAIVLSDPSDVSPDEVGWDDKTGTNPYADGTSRVSSNSGVTWALLDVNTDFTFKTYYIPSAIISAAAQSTGLHDYILSLAGGTLTLKDGVNTLGTASFVGAVVDNANIWAWPGSSTCPYINYIKHTVGVTEVLWYQPNVIISGTNLPDRAVDDGSQNAGITWGTNPANVTVSLSGLGAPATIASSATSSGLPDVVVDVNGLSAASSMASSPFYPLFDAISTMSGGELTPELQGIMFSMVFAIGAAILAGIASQGRSFFLVMVGCLVGCAAGYAMGFYRDIWILYIIGLLAIASLLLDARKSW